MTLSDFLFELLVSFYEITSFQVGDFYLPEFLSNTHLAFLDSPLVRTLQIIAGVMTLLLTIGLLRLASKQRELSKKTESQDVSSLDIAGPSPLQSQWNDILRHIESTREGEWKFAVIEADQITDEVLKNYFPGDTMGERLMNIDKTKLVTIDGLWEAHKTRNRLAHDPNYFLRHAEALRAVRLFEASLKELGVIS